MNYAGTSYKQTGETLTEAYDIPEPSKRAIYGWVTEYTDVAKDILADFLAHTSGKWVADEIQIEGSVMSPKEWLQNQIIKMPDESVKELSICQLPSLDDLLPDAFAEWDKQFEARFGALQASIKPYAGISANPKRIRAKTGIGGSIAIGKLAKARSQSARGKHDSPKSQSDRR